jgi:omega-hydroxy-beta-dihydromenaquinone-9 sulfotransferase
MSDQYDRLGKIFIAGTGRSGTTLLHEIIGAHPDVYKVPFETKFIVEGDGLNALIPRLTDDFSVTASDLALIRFMETMGAPPKSVNSTGPELDLHYAAMIGTENYYPALNDYLRAITDGELLGFPFPKRFERRADLIGLTRAFLSRLFGGLAVKSEKRFWVEKTPSNIIAVDFLWELFPEAVIINIKRDPRGVLMSFMEQIWSPNDLERATEFLGHIYWRWSQLRPRLDLKNQRYLEVKLEDLARHPSKTLAEVAEAAGLTPDFPCAGIDITKVDRWKTQMPEIHRRYCETHLLPYFELTGYDI